MDQPIRQRMSWLRLQRTATALAFCLAAGLAANNLTAQDAASATPAPQADQASGTPQVQPHFSKWDYPKTITPKDGQQVYIVQKGDTLWDLAGKDLNNNYAWPQIWELNQWIKDPHWIYPGDPLIIDAGRGAQGATPEAVTGAQPMQLDVNALRRPEMSFTIADFVQEPFIAPSGADAWYKANGAFQITGKDNNGKTLLGDGDVVYLNAGDAQGVRQGDRFVILQTVKTKLKHPDTGKAMGDVVQQVGILRVDHTTQNGAVATIERSMNSVEIGDHVTRFTEPADMKLDLRTDTDEPVKLQTPLAKVVYARDNHDFNGFSDQVIIDRGTNDGFKVGDMLIVTRTSTWPGATARKDKDSETFEHYLGQAMVIRVEAGSATCRVIRGNEEVEIGDKATH